MEYSPRKPSPLHALDSPTPASSWRVSRFSSGAIGYVLRAFNHAKGIAIKQLAVRFERSFHLADYVEVKGARLENGLLHVDLVREIPEAMKFRSIPITSSSKLLEGKAAKLAA